MPLLKVFSIPRISLIVRQLSGKIKGIWNFLGFIGRQIGTRFAELEDRIDKLEKRLDEIDNRHMQEDLFGHTLEDDPV